MTKKPVNNRNSIGRFVQGSSGNPNGRPVGSRNKFTTLKSAFIEAFEELGGVDNLIEWARCNQTEFYKMLARLMPRPWGNRNGAGFCLPHLFDLSCLHCAYIYKNGLQSKL